MPDEPTLGQVLWRLERIEAEWSRRHDELGKDLAEERGARREADTELRDAIKELRAELKMQTERRGADWRLILFSGLLPLLVVLASTAVQIWIATR